MSPTSKKVVIFDRDGTLIEDVDALSKVELIEWKNEVPNLLQFLHERGVVICVASNQRSISKGKLSIAELKNVTLEMFKAARKFDSRISFFVYCPHGLRNEKKRDSFLCSCRKPRAGMLDYIADRYEALSCKYLFVGDSETDKLAALNSVGAIDFIPVTQNNEWIANVREWVEK